MKLCAASSMYPFGSCFKGTLSHILFLVLLICYSCLLWSWEQLFIKQLFPFQLLSVSSSPEELCCTRPTCTLPSSCVQHELFLKAMMLLKFATNLQSNPQSILDQPYSSDMKIRLFSFFPLFGCCCNSSMFCVMKNRIYFFLLKLQKKTLAWSTTVGEK